MATTGTTAQALEAAEAELSALETEATLLPRRLLLAAQAGTPLDVAALRARQELLPERLLAARERVLEVELTTAVELSDGEAQEIVRRIEEAAGRRVEATRSVDPDLIGGLVLQAGSRRVDASVRGRLNQLREELLVRS